MARPVLRIGIQELRRRPGTQREVHVAVPMPDLVVTGSRVVDDEDVVVDATLEAIDGGITAIGRVVVPWEAECRRCLEPVGGHLDVELDEVFEPHPTEGDTYPIDGDEVDLEPLVRDAALLHLPLAPLCDPDCAGPAPDQFPTTVADDGAAADDDEAPARDPRWAALDALRLDG